MTDRDGTAPPRLEWQTAEVRDVVVETRRVRTFVLDVPGWPGHLPGQHVELRLTGDDGSQAHRVYSIASAPESAQLSLTIERIEEGEVSPYLVGDVRPGDRFELRGPFGRFFVWTVADGGPLFLVAGGTGVVPLMAMLRHRAVAGSTLPAVLLYSSRTFDDIIYRDELDRLAAKGDGLAVVHTLTRGRPAGWSGGTQRIDGAMLGSTGFRPSDQPRIFICGPTSLVESAARLLLALGHEAARIRTERFGPTGVEG